MSVCVCVVCLLQTGSAQEHLLDGMLVGMGMGRISVCASVSSKGCVSLHTQLRPGNGFSCSKSFPG